MSECKSCDNLIADGLLSPDEHCNQDLSADRQDKQSWERKLKDLLMSVNAEHPSYQFAQMEDLVNREKALSYSQGRQEAIDSFETMILVCTSKAMKESDPGKQILALRDLLLDELKKR